MCQLIQHFLHTNLTIITDGPALTAPGTPPTTYYAAAFVPIIARFTAPVRPLTT
jgi:hypothetical protein